MKRIAVLVVAAAVAVAAAVLPEPAAQEVPDLFPVVGRDVVAAGVVYCPWAAATLERDTLITITSAQSAEVDLSFPSPVPGEDADTAGAVISGAGASRLLVSEAVLRGESPLFLESTAADVAAFTMQAEGEALSAEACAGSVPKAWQLTGATTAGGRELAVRVFNPFPENAKVTITAVSEFGSEPLTELEGLGIAARSWRSSWGSSLGAPGTTKALSAPRFHKGISW